MDKLIYDNIIISAKEFMVLSALCGIKKIDFPMKKKQRPPDQKEVNLVLFQLYQKQILEMEDQHTYRLDSEIQKLFMEIKEADYEIQAYSLGKKNPLLFFSGSEIVAIELSENDREALKMRRVSRKRLLEELCSQKILPLEKSAPGGNEEFLQKEILALREQIQKEKIQFIKNDHIDYEKLIKYSEMNRVYSFFIIKDHGSGAEKMVILLMDRGIWDCAVCFEAGHLEIEYYTEKGMEEFLLL
ncbi:MAG: hypothetical protein Q4Q33_10845 [Eubacteriales bacterium]|nr:hypothetical protein [Eubacteriales bacterium]